MSRLLIAGSLSALLATVSTAAAQETSGAAGEATPSADPATPPPSVQFDFGLRGVTSVNGVKSYSQSNAIGVIDFSDTYAYARGRTSSLVATCCDPQPGLIGG